MKTEKTIEMLQGETALLRLEEIEVYDDGSGARALLTINSGYFSCTRYPFYFDHLDLFSRQLQNLYRDLKGDCRLGHIYEKDYISLAVDKLGHVTLHGELLETGPTQQSLRFEVVVDQTYLGPFISTIEAAMTDLRDSKR